MQVLPQRQDWGSALGQGLGQGVAQGVNDYYQDKRQLKMTKLQQALQEQQMERMKSMQQEESKNFISELQPLIANEEWKNLPPQQKILALGQISAKYPNNPMAKQLVQEISDYEQKEAGMKSLPKFTQEQLDKYYQYLPPDLQAAYDVADAGGRTQIMSTWLKDRERGNNFYENKEKKFIDYDRGLTKAEKVKVQNARYSQNLPIYEEHIKSEAAHSEISNALSSLEDLNNSGKLPSGFQRWNVDSEGNLRFPFLSSTEAQLYAKDLNKFVKQAKESFGARVTNFDLQTFMKQFGKLDNTEEARRYMIKEMKVINDLNIAYDKALEKVFKEAGGIRKIDYDEAVRLAKESIEDEVENAKEKLKFYDKKVGIKKEMQAAPTKFIRMKKDGEEFNIPENEVDDAIKDGLVKE